MKHEPVGTAEPHAWLEVLRLDHNDWRVSDARVDVGDFDRIVGYIERLGPWRYEVLWVRATPGWAYVRSFDLAVAAVADREHFDGVIQAERAGAFTRAEPPLLPVSFRHRDADLGTRFPHHAKGAPLRDPIEDGADGDAGGTEPNGLPVEVASGEFSSGKPLGDGTDTSLRTRPAP